MYGPADDELSPAEFDDYSEDSELEYDDELHPDVDAFIDKDN